MNQILATDKIYLTQKLKKKKKIYMILFILSLILVFIFSGWFACSEIIKSQHESVSQDMLEEIKLSNTPIEDTTVAQTQPLVVAMEDTEVIEEIPAPAQNETYTAKSGVSYTYESVLSIPKINIEYPVLTETTDELLEISLTKFWGGSPNSVGNYCVVGHNYKSGKMFGKLSLIKNGDKVKLTDMSGKTVTYEVYNKYVVDPENVECTSQITNGLTEMTLITCTNYGKQRLVVKCRAI